MKRGLVFTLCAAVAAVMASPALAVVDVQLNLRYNRPNDPNGGGTWDLLVQSDSAFGLAGIKANIGGNLGVTGVDLPANMITSNAAVFDNTTSVFRYQPQSGLTEVVAGDDLVSPFKTMVGKPGGPGIVAKDDLFASAPNPWDNSSLVASGSWTGARPTLLAANVLANEFVADGPDPGTDPDIVAAAIGVVSVRGDSMGVDGLKAGDTDRNGTVNLSDLGTLAGKFGTTTGAQWADGDFDGNGNVNLSDLGALAGNFGQSTTSPPIGAVPEPASAALIALSSLAFVGAARRRVR